MSARLQLRGRAAPVRLIVGQHKLGRRLRRRQPRRALTSSQVLVGRPPTAAWESLSITRERGRGGRADWSCDLMAAAASRCLPSRSDVRPPPTPLAVPFSSNEVASGKLPTDDRFDGLYTARCLAQNKMFEGAEDADGQRRWRASLSSGAHVLYRSASSIVY